MKTVKLMLLATMIAASYSTNVQASGIPVYDAASVKQQAMNSMKELAEMAKQLTEAKNQLEQMKANVKALTGLKGFTDILDNGGLSDEITSSFDDLMNGNTSDLIAKSEKYLSKMPTDTCETATDKELCQKATLASIAQLDFAEKLNKQIEQKLENITSLSQRAQKATDMKSMAELQTSIQLEANSIALIEHQMQNFDRLQEAQKDIVATQAHKKYAENMWDGFGKGATSTQTSRANNYSNLLN